MARHRRTYSSARARRTSRKVRESTIGTHVAPSTNTRVSRNRSNYAKNIKRSARIRRVATAVVAVVVVVGAALGAALLAFRGSVGTSMALRDSDATSALVQPKTGEPAYILITAELGAVAEPLETEGPDVILLARVDSEDASLALVNVPSNLQITVDNASKGIASVASEGDAALIEALKSYAKVDIAHIVKLDEQGICDIADALGGVKVNLSQPVDDPRAGTSYLPAGEVTLDSGNVLTFLRAENLKLGIQDKLDNQLFFASKVIEDVFMGPASFQQRIDSIDAFFQTDYTLSDLEGIASWLKGKDASDITCAKLPGYLTSVTGSQDDRSARYIATSDDMAQIISALEEGRQPDGNASSTSDAASPASFTVEVQNGTDVAGAAAITGDLLASQGFSVSKVGNAEQQVYEETLVVYKGDADKPKANAVINALDVGRAVASNGYYSFDSDVLLIIGSDFSPVS